MIRGWFALQQTREQMRTQTPEVARQAVENEMVERIATKASRMAIEATDRAREQNIRRLVAEEVASRPLPREVDRVTLIQAGTAVQQRPRAEPSSGSSRLPSAVPA